MSGGSNQEGGRELGRDPVRDEFEAIVAQLKAQGPVPKWPAPPADPATQPHWVVGPDATTVPVPLTPARPWDDDQEHYIPPEPPPLPRIGPPAIVGAVLLMLGLLLVITPSWLGMSEVYGLPLGLISLAAGLGWLVLRLWPDSVSAVDRDDDPDNGAIV
ncbi:hypothetical protein SAMN05443637_113115 [Pseudonocardia thermophila]|uniref:DUF308 domain-containing protein n=1 Tax=Pseudonocardia thermophila TaxID=1848 RepID=A0A1M6VXW6_PSETH|nr:hypothetical protein [Pseudonocardia thermophila]SHK86218.1 hypothetical protein SAMN05443637_113115 [Pseudonocardia thermophila]